MISMMDKYIGKILDRLDELGLSEDTIVVFTTDHGHFFGQHGLQAKGGFHYEDLIKLPFIVRYPGRVPAGKRSNAIQSLVDLAPTFLSFCGIPVPHAMTGIDQKDVWLGAADTARQHAICEFRHEPSTIHQKRTSSSVIKSPFITIRPTANCLTLKQIPESCTICGTNRDMSN